MPVGFWKDEDNKKFKKAYFEKFQGAWHHGDFVTITDKGGIVIHGRSDSTLNPGGVRIGTSEIYREVESHPALSDSLAVGQVKDGDERILLFVKLKDSAAVLTEALIKEIKDRIRAGASPRHVPALILVTPEIPYTVSGKKVEIAVKQILQGEEPQNVEALSNPKSLDYFRGLRATIR